jgi:hypothetical protein
MQTNGQAGPGSPAHDRCLIRGVPFSSARLLMHRHHTQGRPLLLESREPRDSMCQSEAAFLKKMLSHECKTPLNRAKPDATRIPAIGMGIAY